MTTMFKARHSIFCSLLLVSIVCETRAAFGNNPKKTEASSLQIAESDSPREVFQKALSAAHAVTSYRIRIEAPSVSKAVTVIEYALPDRSRMFEKNEEKLWLGKAELIWIGRSTYKKKGDGPWEKYPEKSSDGSNSDVSRTNLPATSLENHINFLAKAEEVKFIGQGTVDGVPTLSYQHTVGSGAGAFTMRTWIGVADGLLRRWEFACIGLGSTPSPVIHTYYDYNADIKIEPPTEYVSVPLPGPETLQVDPRFQPNRDTLVVTRGAIDISGPPSAGPGRGGGMGPGSDGGVGSGSGGGIGPGRGTGSNTNAPVTSVDSRPILLNSPQPRYTDEARENKVEGTVTLRVLIGSDGLVKRVTIIRGLPDGLDEQALKAAYQMRFKPAMKGGQPVAYQLTALVEFNLRKR